MVTHGRSTRKRTGGRLRPTRDRRKHEIGNEPTETRLDDRKLKFVDARGNTEKIRALTTDVANVADDGETVEAEIADVVENDANPNYVRRNIITKGAIIETADGDEARVTSRPGQTGQINAVKL